jgi:hypothetical protein
MQQFNDERTPNSRAVWKVKQMNIVLALDNATAHELENLAPHKNCLDINRPRTLSNAASLPTPVASTIANWMSFPAELEQDPVKLDFLRAMALPA